MYQLVGFGLALMSMVLYGLYMVPRKWTAISPRSFTFWMGTGILVGTTVLGVAFNGLSSITVTQHVTMFVCGLIWATGTHAYCRAVQLIGLSRSTPIKNTSAMLGTLLGVFVLREFPNSGLSAALVTLGSLAVVMSATLLGRVECPDDAVSQKVNSRYLLYGVLCSVWAAVAYSVWTIPMKQLYGHGVSPSAFLFYMGQGCFIGMMAMALLAGPGIAGQVVTWRDRGLAQISGLMWAVGSLCANVAVKHIGVAVTWPLTKNTVVAVLYGVLVLKEVDTLRHRRALRAGLALSVVGVVLLALAEARR